MPLQMLKIDAEWDSNVAYRQIALNA